jgi:hypothetical protein
MTLSKDKCGQRRLPNPEEEEGQGQDKTGGINWERRVSTRQPHAREVKAVALRSSRHAAGHLNVTGLPLHFTSLFNSARKLAAPPFLHLRLQSPACGL